MNIPIISDLIRYVLNDCTFDSKCSDCLELHVETHEIPIETQEIRVEIGDIKMKM